MTSTTLKVQENFELLARVFSEYNIVRKNCGVDPINITVLDLARYFNKYGYNPRTFPRFIRKRGPLRYIDRENSLGNRRKRAERNRLKQEEKKARWQKHIDTIRFHERRKLYVIPSLKTKIAIGWVYIATHPSFPDWIKIGQTIDVDKRLATYQTGCPHHAYEMPVIEKVMDRLAAEKILHEKFSAYRDKGEWFNIPLRDAQKLLRETVRELREEKIEK